MSVYVENGGLAFRSSVYLSDPL